MTVEFEVVTTIAASMEAAFDLSLDIDAHLSSMSKSGERAIAGVTSGQIGLAESVTWRARHFGIPFTMTSKVTEWERPRRFVDEQLRGPFRSFRHEHLFDAVEGSTTMTDQVRFEAPLGPIGRLIERTLLARYLRQLIQERGKYLKLAAERQNRS